jgi:acyl dehydratase
MHRLQAHVVKIDKTWQREHKVTRDEAIAYARATNDTNQRYGEIAPPMFGVFLEMPPLMEAVKDPLVIGDPARFLRLLHGEHDMRWHGAILPGRTYTTVCSVQSVSQKSSGEVIELRLETKDSSRLVVETVSTMFIRSETPGPKEPKQPAAAEPERKIVLQAQEVVAADQSVRYAAASGDHNPIHTDPEVAKKAGLPGIILHGLCSMAFCQKAIVDQLCAGDPMRLKRLKVRFAKPVLMGQTLDIVGWGPAPLGFEMRVGKDVVIKDGLAEIA